MDPEKAKVLFDEGGTLVFLNVPEGTEFGIDYNSWNVGPNFRGVKMIPPGLHFIYYSSVNSNQETAPRTGFFHFFKQKEVLVKEWDPYMEDIKEKSADEATVDRILLNKRDMDRYLGAYPYENYKKWVSLTSYITENLLLTVQPANEKISSVTEFVSETSTSQSRKKAAEAELKSTADMEIGEASNETVTLADMEKRLPKMETVPGTEIRFSQIPKMKYPPGSTPKEITKYSMDSSYALECMIQRCYKNEDKKLGILGEIQFAFICFIVAQVYDAFEQWKKMVHLLCSCEEALNTHTDLFMKFIPLMHFQIREIPEDFFVDIVSSHNFLTQTLQEFFSNVKSSPADQALKKRASEFCEHLTRKFNWDFESDPSDYDPVVVDTD